MSAVVADDKAADAQAPAPDITGVKPATQDKPTPAAAPSETPEPKVPTFFSKKKETADKPSDDLSLGVDVSKLDPKLQPLYKQMQAGLTQKFQSMAEERKKWQDDFESQRLSLTAEREALQKSHEAILEAFTRGKPGEAPAQAAPDAMAQIQALRDEGRYQEADSLFLKHVESLAEERIKPIEARANADRQVAAFQKLAIDTLTTNPKVREYHQQVVAQWDAPTLEMQQLRADVLSSPERMQMYLPKVLDYLATIEHAKALEANMEKVVEFRVKQALESNRAKARSVPPSLVSTGGVSRETRGSGGGLEGAFQRALTKITSEA